MKLSSDPLIALEALSDTDHVGVRSLIADYSTLGAEPTAINALRFVLAAKRPCTVCHGSVDVQHTMRVHGRLKDAWAHCECSECGAQYRARASNVKREAVLPVEWMKWAL